MQYQRGDGADQKKSTTTDTIDVRQDDACCHQEDDILDGGGVEGGVSGKASHAEHCCNRRAQVSRYSVQSVLLESFNNGLP
jgi:hypothetical protein